MDYSVNANIYAPNPNYINADWRIKQRDYLETLLDELLQYLKSTGLTRLHVTKIRDSLSCVIANARQSAVQGRQVLYSRRNENAPYKIIIDWLALTGRLKNVIGRANSYQGATSWFVPIDTYAYELERHSISIELAKNASMLELNTANPKNPNVWLSTTPDRNTRMISDLSDPVRLYNKLWCNHVATVGNRALVPFNRRIFNHNYHLGGRYYGGDYIGLKRTVRPDILIDNEPTCEPDYSALHLYILYAWEGIQLQDDPYVMGGLDRNTAKALMLRLLNFTDTRDFKGRVTYSSNPDNKALYASYKESLDQYSSGLMDAPPYKPDCLKGFIEGLPDGLKGNDVLEAITKRHTSIAHYFGSENLGLRLQFADSQIMSRVLKQCAKQDKPVLPLHDSLRCKASDLDAVIGFMATAYSKELGFTPKIKC